MKLFKPVILWLALVTNIGLGSDALADQWRAALWLVNSLTGLGLAGLWLQGNLLSPEQWAK